MLSNIRIVTLSLVVNAALLLPIDQNDEKMVRFHNALEKVKKVAPSEGGIISNMVENLKSERDQLHSDIVKLLDMDKHGIPEGLQVQIANEVKDKRLNGILGYKPASEIPVPSYQFVHFHNNRKHLGILNIYQEHFVFITKTEEMQISRQYKCEGYLITSSEPHLYSNNYMDITLYKKSYILLDKKISFDCRQVIKGPDNMAYMKYFSKFGDRLPPCVQQKIIANHIKNLLHDCDLV